MHVTGCSVFAPASALYLVQAWLNTHVASSYLCVPPHKAASGHKRAAKNMSCIELENMVRSNYALCTVCLLSSMLLSIMLHFPWLLLATGYT